MKKFLRKLLRRLFFGLVTRQDLDRLYDQIAGLQQIQNAMEGRPVLRPMRGWAISPDAMAWVLAGIQEFKSPTVIEFGSGQSTIILAAALKHRGGRLLSVEHNPEYSAIIQRQVEACGLSGLVEPIHAPLVSVDDSPEVQSYDILSIPDVWVDVALIDGPPVMICGADTRLIPLRWAARHLTPDGSIFLDDSTRSSEQSCIEKLKEEFPNLEVLPRRAEKGLVEIRVR